MVWVQNDRALVGVRVLVVRLLWVKDLQLLCVIDVLRERGVAGQRVREEVWGEAVFGTNL